jgi:hypothetical protein
MQALYDTLSRRLRPEDVAQRVIDAIGHQLLDAERRTLEKAARGSLTSRWLGFTSMSQDWSQAVGLSPQLETARALFASAPVLAVGDADVPERIEAFLDSIEPEIGKVRGENDFEWDRLDRSERNAVGLSISHRKYNRKWRLLRRIERRLASLRHELRKRHMEKVAKVGFVTSVPKAAFLASPSAAAFVAYLAAKKAKRSTFTVWGQERPFDEIAAMLLDRCKRMPDTDWFVVAHAWPTPDVLARLDDEQRLSLLVLAMSTLREAAGMLEALYVSNPLDRSAMIVRRGDDSTTWNQLAGAFNAARDAWVALSHAMGASHVVEAMCVPKAMRLIAGDVASWHRAVGHRGDPNVAVAASLPLPWEVLDGDVECTAHEVAYRCRSVGLDPEKSGWVAPRPRTEVAPFRPTPELVHGVAVVSPRLASLLKKEGVFSGKRQERHLLSGAIDWLAKVGRSGP